MHVWENVHKAKEKTRTPKNRNTKGKIVQPLRTSLTKVIWEEGCGAVAHVRRKSPLVLMARPKFAPKSTPFRGPIPKPDYTCLIPGPVQPMTPNGIRIRSAVFPQCTGQTDRPTHRSRESLMTLRPLRYESDAA